MNLAGLGPFAEDPDRSIRHEAERVRWAFFAANADELDALYDQLVKLRHGMARKLGFPTFTPLGYRRLRRVDYGPDDVARYREQVARARRSPGGAAAGGAPRGKWLGPAALLG